MSEFGIVFTCVTNIRSTYYGSGTQPGAGAAEPTEGKQKQTWLCSYLVQETYINK